MSKEKKSPIFKLIMRIEDGNGEPLNVHSASFYSIEHLQEYMYEVKDLWMRKYPKWMYFTAMACDPEDDLCLYYGIKNTNPIA